ncbi:MAG: phosphoribosylanthranilate isomerase [Kiritimatiellia bacterium]|jgi:phosphoribosylanthranilate isomerase
MFVKICGLTNAEDVAAVAALKPNAIGFVFWAGSPRCVNPADVKAWTKTIPSNVMRVGVFVDEDPQTVSRVIAQAGLNIVQLHGSELPSDVSQVAGLCWKAVHLDKMSVAEADRYPVRGVLIDQYNADMPGGTGEQADWALAADFVQETRHKVLLAGGLTPDNVAEAIEQVKPWGVDVSSGVEAEPGRKDLQRVADFITKSRAN